MPMSARTENKQEDRHRSVMNSPGEFEVRSLKCCLLPCTGLCRNHGDTGPFVPLASSVDLGDGTARRKNTARLMWRLVKRSSRKLEEGKS